MSVSDDGSELFPLVTADGSPAGVATRAECHADPSLIHPSLHVAVLTAEGVLWQLRGYRKDSGAGTWDHACSGHMGVGEEPEQAAVREVAEELGIEIAADALELLDRHLVSLDGETELTWIYRTRHDGPFRVVLPEVAGLAVFPPGERPAPMSASCAWLSAKLDVDHPGGTAPRAHRVCVPTAAGSASYSTTSAARSSR